MIKLQQSIGQQRDILKSTQLIVVLPFINKTDKQNDSWVTAGLMDMLENSLAYQASFNTYPSREILNLYKYYSIPTNKSLTKSQLSIIVKATGADFVVETSFDYAIPANHSLFSAKTTIHTISDQSKIEKEINHLAPGEIISQLSLQLIERFIRNSFSINFSVIP